MRHALVFLVFLVCGQHAAAQQVADSDYRPQVGAPAFGLGKGPLVRIDEAHFNFHTAGSRYRPFAELLRRDGYVVQPSTAKLSAASLGKGGILVIANALGARNQHDWEPPIDPAFTEEEIKAVHEWVKGGGALLLIVDHPPFPAAAASLAERFGVRFAKGAAFAHAGAMGNPDVFSRKDAALVDHPITRERGPAKRVESVATFGGSAFQGSGVEPLLAFVDPDATARASDGTPSERIHGWLQGGVLRVGKGRVAIFGEAAMFTAQVAGEARAPMGMNHPLARQNGQLVLNVLHWLSARLE